MSLIVTSMGLVICAEHHEEVSSDHSHAHFEHFEMSDHHSDEDQECTDKNVLDQHILSDFSFKIKAPSFLLASSAMNHADFSVKHDLIITSSQIKPERIHSPHNNTIKQIRTIVIRT